MSDTFAAQCIRSVALGLMLTACFDVEQVDVEDDRAPAHALMIDDFEDGDGLPLNPSFVHWFCFWYPVQCGVSSPGASSGHGYSMTFERFDSPDGKTIPAGAQLRTWRVGTQLDFTPYEDLVFSAKLVPNERGLPDSVVVVELSCPNGSDLGNDRLCGISSGISAGTGWRTYKLPLVDFTPTIDVNESTIPRGGRVPPCEVVTHRCLTQIDGLNFQVWTRPMDGQPVGATLMIDDVYLR